MAEAKPKALHHREYVGTVIRTKMKKTAVVEVTRFAPHPVYKKVVQHRKRYLVHDEKEVAKPGQKVRMAETRPLSKHKHWRLVEVLQ